MPETAKGGSGTAPESDADGAIDAGFGIEFIFPFRPSSDLHSIKRISRPEVSGIAIFEFRPADSAFRNPHFSPWNVFFQIRI
jgi:hypothetical protein